MPAGFPHPERHRDQGKDTAAVHTITAIKYSEVSMETGKLLFAHCPGKHGAEEGGTCPGQGRGLCVSVLNPICIFIFMKIGAR